MLEKEKFIEEITREFEEVLGNGYTLERREVQKNNGVKRFGLVIHGAASNVAPVIYFDELFDAYIDGYTIRDLVLTTVERIIKENEKLEKDYHRYMDYDQVKDKIAVQLINYEKNEELLKELPHKKFLDLAVVFRIILGERKGELITSQVTEQILKTWGVSVDEVYETAIENSPKLLPVLHTSLSSVLFGIEDMGEDEGLVPKLYLLSNTYGINGAASILYTDVLKEISAQLNADLIILPSSVSEVLVLGLDDKADIKKYKSIVEAVNDHDVAEQEILSYSVYVYRRKSDIIEIASDENFVTAA